MTVRVYVIGASARLDEAGALINALIAQGYRVYDWPRHFDRAVHTRAEMTNIAEQEIVEVMNAEAIVVLHPLGTGGSFELGFARACGKMMLHAGAPDPHFIFTDLTDAKPLAASDHVGIIEGIEGILRHREEAGLVHGGSDLVVNAIHTLSNGLPSGDIVGYKRKDDSLGVTLARTPRAVRFVNEAATVAKEENEKAKLREFQRIGKKR